MKGRKLIAIVITLGMILNLAISGTGVAKAATKGYVKSLKVTASLSLKAGEKRTVTAKVSIKKKAKSTVTATSNKKSIAKVNVKGKKITITGVKEGKAVLTVRTTGKNKKGKRLVRKIKVTVLKSAKVVTENPTAAPTVVPTAVPPIQIPTQAPTKAPTQSPTQVPTPEPTVEPTMIPTETPIMEPTVSPTETPSPTPIPVMVSSLEFTNISNEKLQMDLGDSLSLQVSILPVTATNKSLLYTSTNEDVAIVSEAGKIEAVGVGTAQVKARTQDGSDLEAICNVSVKKRVKTINLTCLNTNLTIGDKATILSEVLPLDATDKSLTYTSTDNDVVTVDSMGQVTAVGSGSAIVTATAKDGSGVYKSLDFTVIAESYTMTNIGQLNNTDFSIVIKAKRDSEKKMTEYTRDEIEEIFGKTTLKMKSNDTKIEVTADYVSYSFDKDEFTYKVNEDGQKLLQPNKNEKQIGSADGKYKVTSDMFAISGDNEVKYQEALVGNSVSGYVYDYDDEEALKGVKVSVSTETETRTAETDETGYYYVPAAAGVYTVKAEVQGTDTEKYFQSSSSTKVSANYKSACNFYMEKYDRENLFISGIVKSNKTRQALGDAKVILYKVNKDGSKTQMAEATTIEGSGAFVFKNCDVDNDNSDYLNIVNETYKLTQLTKQNQDKCIKTFDYEKGLSKEDSYVIEISKDLSSENMSDVYEEKTLTNISFGHTKYYNANATLLSIGAVRSMTMNTKWEESANSDLSDSENLHVGLYHKTEDGIYRQLTDVDIDNVTVDETSHETDELNLLDKKLFGEVTAPTLPSGTYYLLVEDDVKKVGTTDEGSYANAREVVKVTLEAGKDCDISAVTLNKAYSTKLTLTCGVQEEKALLNNSNDGENIKLLKNADGELLVEENQNIAVPLMINLYEVKEDDKILLNKELNTEGFRYYSDGSVKCDYVFKRMNGDSVYYPETVKDYVTGQDVEFTQEKNFAGNAQSRSCKGAANINSVKLFAKNKLDMQSGLETPDKVEVEYVELQNEYGDKVAKYSFEDKEIDVDEFVSDGVTIPDEAEGFRGVKPGNYKMAVKLKDFSESISNTFSVIDFQKVDVSFENIITHIQKTTLTGTITTGNDENFDVKDDNKNTIDVSLFLYNSENKIVGATTYGTSDSFNYLFENGNNAKLEAGTYKLIARCDTSRSNRKFEDNSNPNATQHFETVIKTGIVIKENEVNTLDISVTKGGTGGITRVIKDSNQNNLINGEVLMFDENAFSVKDNGREIDAEDQWIRGVGIEDVIDECYQKSSSLLGIYSLTQGEGEEANEWKAVEMLPGGKYTAAVYSAYTTPEHFSDITVVQEKHTAVANWVVPFLAGTNSVAVTVKYYHHLEVGKTSPFEMIVVMDSDNKVVAIKHIDRYSVAANTDEGVVENEQVISIPNVVGNYKFAIYSNGSFISDNIMPIQGTSKELTISLSNVATDK